MDALAAELSAASAEFAELWRHYDVRTNLGGPRRLHHPDEGPVELTSEILADAGGQRLVVFLTTT